VISPVLVAVVVRHLTIVVLLLQKFLFIGDVYAVVQLHVVSPVLSAVVVRHLKLVVLLQQLFLI
jgi:hypothetical protein